MQAHARRTLPAVIVLIVHAAILVGLQSVRPQPHALPEDAALPIVLLAREAAPLPPLAAPGAGAAVPLTSFAITIPDTPTALAPQVPLQLGPSPLDAYVACGLGQALNDQERHRCGELRLKLYARPDAAPSPDYDRELAQRYTRDKALQDHPLLRVCYRRSGPDPLCFSRGYEVLYGAAARDSIPLPIGDPLKPR